MAATKAIDLKIDFWDVGQGDCSVVHLPSGELFIIDVGPPRSALVEWLASKNDTRIHTIVITHNDDDHVGCLPHLLEIFHTRIGQLVIQLDRNSESLREMLHLVKKSKVKPVNLQISEVPLPLYWTDDGNVIISAVHPGFADTVCNLAKKRPTPNEVSGIICLDVNGEREVIWPGDVSMQTLTDVCEGEAPRMIVGPHHGAPIKRNGATYSKTFDKINPSEVFVSVGTGGGHRHPEKNFIKRHVERGRRVTCSQLVHCDSDRKRHKKHVLDHHLLLGVLPPHDLKAVTCRGPIQLTWNSADGEFDFDIYHEKHWAIVESRGVCEPLCLGGKHRTLR